LVPNQLAADSKSQHSQELTAPPANACTPACTPNAETGNTGDADADFAAALTMIATLPLSPAEKAEAVRRLLAGREGGKP